MTMSFCDKISMWQLQTVCLTTTAEQRGCEQSIRCEQYQMEMVSDLVLRNWNEQKKRMKWVNFRNETECEWQTDKNSVCMCVWTSEKSGQQMLFKYWLYNYLHNDKI